MRPKIWSQYLRPEATARTRVAQAAELFLISTRLYSLASFSPLKSLLLGVSAQRVRHPRLPGQLGLYIGRENRNFRLRTLKTSRHRLLESRIPWHSFKTAKSRRFVASPPCTCIKTPAWLSRWTPRTCHPTTQWTIWLSVTSGWSVPTPVLNC